MSLHLARAGKDFGDAWAFGMNQREMESDGFRSDINQRSERNRSAARALAEDVLQGANMPYAVALPLHPDKTAGRLSPRSKCRLE